MCTSVSLLSVHRWVWWDSYVTPAMFTSGVAPFRRQAACGPGRLHPGPEPRSG